jgi:hypothetical protein
MDLNSKLRFEYFIPKFKFKVIIKMNKIHKNMNSFAMGYNFISNHTRIFFKVILHRNLKPK